MATMYFILHILKHGHWTLHAILSFELCFIPPFFGCLLPCTRFMFLECAFYICIQILLKLYVFSACLFYLMCIQYLKRVLVSILFAVILLLIATKCKKKFLHRLAYVLSSTIASLQKSKNKKKETYKSCMACSNYDCLCNMNDTTV